MTKKSMLVGMLVALALVFAQGAMAQVTLTLKAGDGVEKAEITKTGGTELATPITTWSTIGDEADDAARTANVKATLKDADYKVVWTQVVTPDTDKDVSAAPTKAEEAYVVKGAANTKIDLTAKAGFEVELKVGKNGKVTATGGIEDLKDLEADAKPLVEKDKKLKLTLAPAADYVAAVTLDGEAVEVANDVAEVTITKKGQKVEVAFNMVKYEIKATAEPAEGGTITGAGSYEKGADVTLTATPADGYEFVSWSEDGAAIADAVAAYTFKAEKDRTLVATFEETGCGCGKKDASKMMGDLLLVGITLMGLFTLGSLRKH